MNPSVYIFGEFSAGYDRYPADSSDTLLRKAKGLCQAQVQLITHRDGPLMWYMFVRRLDDGGYAGFAAAVNGVYVRDLRDLYVRFRRNMERLVKDGVILNFTDGGSIRSSVGRLTEEEGEVRNILDRLRSELASIDDVAPLPPDDYSVSIDSIRIVEESEWNSGAVEDTCRYGYTVLLVRQEFDSVRFRNYRNTLKNLRKRVESRDAEIARLAGERDRISREKKQFKWVMVLLVLIAVCAAGLYMLDRNLRSTEDERDDALTTVAIQKSEIGRLTLSLDSLKQALEHERSAHNSVRRELKDLYGELERYQPFIAVSYDISSTDCSFRYHSPCDRVMTLQLRAVCESDGETLTASYPVSLKAGGGNISLKFPRPLDTSRYYMVTVLWDGRVIGGKRW